MCAPCPHTGLALFFPFLTSLPLGSLETSALHVALVSEWAAFGWRGAFVHLDLTLISRGSTNPLVPFANRDSTGTLFVATALVGIAQYRTTRRVVALLLVIFLDVVMALAVVVQLFHWTLSAKRVDAQVAANAAAGGGGGSSFGDEEQGGGGGAPTRPCARRPGRCPRPSRPPRRWRGTAPTGHSRRTARAPGEAGGAPPRRSLPAVPHRAAVASPALRTQVLFSTREVGSRPCSSCAAAAGQRLPFDVSLPTGPAAAIAAAAGTFRRCHRRRRGRHHRRHRRRAMGGPTAGRPSCTPRPAVARCLPRAPKPLPPPLPAALWVARRRVMLGSGRVAQSTAGQAALAPARGEPPWPRLRWGAVAAAQRCRVDVAGVLPRRYSSFPSLHPPVPPSQEWCAPPPPTPLPPPPPPVLA